MPRKKVTTEMDLLDTKAVAEHLGLRIPTINRYLYESRAPGRRYSDHPFPEPAGRVSRRSFWLRSQLPAIDLWASTRPNPHGKPR